MNIVYPNDHSSASIQRLLDAADSDVLFLGDPQVNIEPGPRMFDRMAQVMRETGAGWVYADAVAILVSTISAGASATVSTLAR